MFKNFFGSEEGKKTFAMIQFDTYVNDIAIMASYASENGKNLKTDDLAGRIAALLNLKDPTVQGERSQGVTPEMLTQAIEVHSQLSHLITPLTAASLNSTKPGFLSQNHVIQFINISTIVSLILMISLLVIKETGLINDSTGMLVTYLLVFLASCLGSGVYCLYAARRYLIDRTFDPRYNATYIIRLIIGIIMGTILGLFGENLFEGDISSKLGQVVMAIVGGFSSDAVARILERIADTLQALVRGSGREAIEVETTKAKAAERNKALNVLLTVKNKISGGSVSPEEINTLLGSIDEYIG